MSFIILAPQSRLTVILDALARVLTRVRSIARARVKSCALVLSHSLGSARLGAHRRAERACVFPFAARLGSARLGSLWRGACAFHRHIQIEFFAALLPYATK